MLEVMIMDGSVWFQSKEVRGAQYSLPLDWTAQKHKPQGHVNAVLPHRSPTSTHHTHVARREELGRLID